MKDSYELNEIKEELQEVKQELRIQNLITILKLTMRVFTRDEVVKMLSKIEENPNKKFSELVDEILMEWR